MLALGVWRNRARASAVELEQEFAELGTVRDGLVTRDQAFLSWEEGLRAAELDPDAIPLPPRATARLLK